MGLEFLFHILVVSTRPLGKTPSISISNSTILTLAPSNSPSFGFFYLDFVQGLKKYEPTSTPYPTTHVPVFLFLVWEFFFKACSNSKLWYTVEVASCREKNVGFGAT